MARLCYRKGSRKCLGPVVGAEVLQRFGEWVNER